MTSFAFVGDVTTTTALAVAAGWRDRTAPIIVEADPSGGSLAGWLGLDLSPSLSTFVTNLAQQPTTPAREALARTVQHSRAGVDVVVAPFRSIEAARSIAEAEPKLVDAASSHPRPMLFDHGRLDARSSIPTTATRADLIVVVHRQTSASSAASAVRVERTAELIERIDASTEAPTAVAVVGHEPFDANELVGFWERSTARRLVTIDLPEDRLAAATLAGRVGVSARRLTRLPLMRAGVDLAALLASHARTPDEHEPRRRVLLGPGLEDNGPHPNGMER